MLERHLNIVINYHLNIHVEDVGYLVWVKSLADRILTLSLSWCMQCSSLFDRITIYMEHHFIETSCRILAAWILSSLYAHIQVVHEIRNPGLCQHGCSATNGCIHKILPLLEGGYGRFRSDKLPFQEEYIRRTGGMKFANVTNKAQDDKNVINRLLPRVFGEWTWHSWSPTMMTYLWNVNPYINWKIVIYDQHKHTVLHCMIST